LLAAGSNHDPANIIDKIGIRYPPPGKQGIDHNYEPVGGGEQVEKPEPGSAFFLLTLSYMSIILEIWI